MPPSQARGPEAPVSEPPPPKAPPKKSAAAALAGSEFNGVKAERIRPGSDTQVAVIGRSMEPVEKYAEGLKGTGTLRRCLQETRFPLMLKNSGSP